jgi:uncharacterized protein (DUF4415 family)
MPRLSLALRRNRPENKPAAHWKPASGYWASSFQSIAVLHNDAYNTFMTDQTGNKGKTRITIRIDTDVLDWFKSEVDTAGDGNYQTLINRALREFIHDRNQFNENLLRRVIREELAATKSTPATFKSNTTISR